MAKVTIFGLAGTGTSTVGKMLAEKLQYKFISSGDIFRKKAKDSGITLPELHERIKNDPEFDKRVDEEIKKFGKENNNFVVESRLAWYFIPDSVKVKLDCGFEVRTKRLAERDNLSYEAAKEHIETREKRDAARYKNFYDIGDIGSDEHFDLVIDATKIPPEKVVEQIEGYLQNERL